MTSSTYDTTAPRASDAELAALLFDVTAASEELARSAVVPEGVRELIRTLPDRLHADAPSRALFGDPYLAEHAYAGAARAAVALLDADPRAARRSVRLAVEQLRQALRDVLEAGPVDEDVPAKEVAPWLEATLGLPQQQIAGLMGVSVRTWQRWLTDGQPEGAQLARLRRVARLVLHLRHTLTGPGVARWFLRPHPLLKDGAGTPADLLDDSEGYRVLVELAAGLRSSAAT